MRGGGVWEGVLVSGGAIGGAAWAVSLCLFVGFGVLGFDVGFRFSSIMLCLLGSSFLMVGFRMRGRCGVRVSRVYVW